MDRAGCGIDTKKWLSATLMLVANATIKLV
jgi:hypothetical protein